VFQPGQGQGGSQVTIQYREFGVRLGFRGEIISDSLIKLQLTPEVSSLDYANAVTLQGFRIPAFRTRRINTTLDVRKDQSLVVSGLFTGEEESIKTGIPLLKDIPILGTLFSSSRFQRNETELLVIVTPILGKIVGSDEDARRGIARQFEQLVGPEGAAAIEVMLKDPDVVANVAGEEVAEQVAASTQATTRPTPDDARAAPGAVPCGPGREDSPPGEAGSCAGDRRAFPRSSLTDSLTVG
jgi:type II secretory pathway component GspD/PulD (secretin)